MSIEAMKRALEALDSDNPDIQLRAATALRAAIEQAEKPVEQCPECERNKFRAAMWRAEAYKQAGHDKIERPWVGLSINEARDFYESKLSRAELINKIDEFLEEKNHD